MRGYKVLSLLPGCYAGTGARMMSRHHSCALLTPLWRRRWNSVGYWAIRIRRERRIPSDWGVSRISMWMIRMHGSEQRMMHQRMVWMEWMSHVWTRLLGWMHYRLRNRRGWWWKSRCWGSCYGRLYLRNRLITRHRVFTRSGRFARTVWIFLNIL